MDSFWYEVGMYLSIAGAAIGITLLAARLAKLYPDSPLFKKRKPGGDI